MGSVEISEALLALILPWMYQVYQKFKNAPQDNKKATIGFRGIPSDVISDQRPMISPASGLKIFPAPNLPT